MPNGRPKTADLCYKSGVLEEQLRHQGEVFVLKKYVLQQLVMPNPSTCRA